MTVLYIDVIYCIRGIVLTFYQFCNGLIFFCPFPFFQYYRIHAVLYRSTLTAHFVPLLQ